MSTNPLADYYADPLGGRSILVVRRAAEQVAAVANGHMPDLAAWSEIDEETAELFAWEQELLDG